MKLLIIEDDKSLREIMHRALTCEGYVVEVAPTYFEACDKIAGRLSGVKFAAPIRALKPDAPIYTASAPARIAALSASGEPAGARSSGNFILFSIFPNLRG